jgi:hypothetical protein
MTHFARVENGLVTQVIVAEPEFIASGAVGDAAQWLQTSYNTRGGQHYGATGEPDSGVALRGNYAGIGFTYDAENDVFYAPQPYASWQLNTTTWTWAAPVAMPDDAGTGTPPKQYTWDEDTVSWKAAV